MFDLVSVINKFGLPMGFLVALSGCFIWVLKITMKHFIETIDKQTEERKHTNEMFVQALEKNTQILSETYHVTHQTNDSIKEIMRLVVGK